MTQPDACSFSVASRPAFNSTGKERDTETGLDYFGARYYGSNMGRWMSPDWAERPTALPYAQLRNPQSLNRYSYSGNNPVSSADADGHCWPVCEVITRVSEFVARHPGVAAAAERVSNSLTLKASGGVGVQTPSSLPVSGAATATGYVKVGQSGISVGLDLNGGAKLGGAGGQANVNIPIVKDNALVNPLTSTSGDIAPIVGGSKGKLEVQASVGSEESSIGGTYGEGLLGGLELGAATDALGDLAGAIIGGLYSDAQEAVTNLRNLENGGAIGLIQEQPQSCDSANSCK